MNETYVTGFMDKCAGLGVNKLQDYMGTEPFFRGQVETKAAYALGFIRKCAGDTFDRGLNVAGKGLAGTALGSVAGGLGGVATGVGTMGLLALISRIAPKALPRVTALLREAPLSNALTAGGALGGMLGSPVGGLAGGISGIVRGAQEPLTFKDKLKDMFKMSGYDTALGGTNVTTKAYVPPSKAKSKTKPEADLSGKIGLENMYKNTYDKGKLPKGYRSPED